MDHDDWSGRSYCGYSEAGSSDIWHLLGWVGPAWRRFGHVNTSMSRPGHKLQMCSNGLLLYSNRTGKSNIARVAVHCYAVEKWECVFHACEMQQCDRMQCNASFSGIAKHLASVYGHKFMILFYTVYDRSMQQPIQWPSAKMLSTNCSEK